MITIDMLDEHVSLPVKPKMKHDAPEMLRAPGQYLPMHVQAQEHHRQLLENAYQIRLLKAIRAKQLAEDVCQYMKRIKSEVLTLAERYARRNVHPA
jgi:hypothetical protein